MVSTDAVRQAIRMRAARATQVAAFLETGHAMEARNGLLHILRTKAYKQATTRRERDRNALLVLGENRDRWALFEGVLEASDLRSRSLSAVQAVWHEARVAAMPDGYKYESPSGEVVCKGQ